MNKLCKECKCVLTIENAAKKNKKYYRNICKPCRSKEVSKSYAGNEKRKSYMREYIRRKGIVKEYPCEYCEKPCYKKYAKAFCSDECRFMSYVKKTDECWEWTGAKNRGAYGRFSFVGIKSIAAHRASYLLFVGEIIENMCVCHTCDNPSCVNPEHLWLGTTQENTKDMVKKGRSLSGERNNNSKLRYSDILRIHELNDYGKYTQVELAKEFGVTPGHINNILRQRMWCGV
jgi:hypothetical protein